MIKCRFLEIYLDNSNCIMRDGTWNLNLIPWVIQIEVVCRPNFENSSLDLLLPTLERLKPLRLEW